MLQTHEGEPTRIFHEIHTKHCLVMHVNKSLQKYEIQATALLHTHFDGSVTQACSVPLVTLRANLSLI